MSSIGRIGLMLLVGFSLTGCRDFFPDFVNYGFSQHGLRAIFEFFGGEIVESNIEPLTEKPVIVLGNGLPETATIALPDGPYILPVGNPYAIGELPGRSCLSRILHLQISELSSIILYDIDADEDDNDAEQLLLEIVTGESPSLGDEVEPGISGVKLVDITPDRYTLTFSDGDATDTLTLTGPGIQTVLQNLNMPADATNDANALSLINAETDTVLLGDTPINPIWPTAGDRLHGADEIHAFLEAVLRDTPDDISLIRVRDEFVSMFVTHPETGTKDLFVFYNVAT